MSLAEIALAIVFVAGAIFVVWVYTLTERGCTLGQDIQRAKKRHLRWWLSKAFLAHHWPLFVLIPAYMLFFALLAPNL